MKELFIKNRKKLLLIFAWGIILAVFYFFLHCPIKYLFGVCCPGCGMTRAALSVLHLDFSDALHYHPAVFIMPFVVAVFQFKSKINPKIYTTLVIMFAVIFMGIYLYRLISGSDVVYINFEEGLVFKIIEYIRETV